MQPRPGSRPTGSRLRTVAARFALRTVAALVVLAVPLGLGAASARAAYPGQNGKFVYASTSCPCGLVLVDRNGSARITSSGIIGEPGSQIVRNDDFGVISPDGKWVAFQRSERTGDFHPAGNPGLYVVRTDGTQLRMLDANSSAASELTKPTWSGDGSKLAYARNVTGAGDEVRVVDATGPPNPRIVEATAPHPFDVELKAASVAWSPTDDVLAVVYNRFEGGLVQSRGIGLLDVSADDPSDLAPLVSFAGPLSYPSHFGDYGEPAWSPDGGHIAFTHTELDVASDTGTARVETIKRDGTERKPLIPFPQADDFGFAGYTQHPLWSPDGQWIVWKSTLAQTSEWQGAHPDGSGRSRIEVGGSSADWGPCFAACASLRPASANPPDGDGDGVPDASDSCPTVPGPAGNDGCPVVTQPPDGDGDGTPDASDSCPALPGPASNAGCPIVTPPADGDHDGVIDASDACPTVPGPASNSGCPVVTPPDGDEDGVPDASDSCPAVAGPASNHGCPLSTRPADRDHDGVPDTTDSCSSVPGPASNHGCPMGTQPADRDLDGVPDAIDSCSAAVGVASNAGCPVTGGDHTGPAVVIPRSNASIAVTKAGRLRFRIGSAGERATGVLTLKTARKVRLGRGRPRIAGLGSKSFRTVAGRQADVTVTLKRRIMALLRRKRGLRVSATITLRDLTGNASVRRYDFKIRAPRSRP